MGGGGGGGTKGAADMDKVYKIFGQTPPGQSVAASIPSSPMVTPVTVKKESSFGSVLNKAMLISNQGSILTPPVQKNKNQLLSGVV